MTARSSTRPSRQPRRPIEDWRPIILDAALQIIASDGASTLSMEGISREISLAKPRVYAAYPSLTELLDALHARESQRVLTQLDSVLESIGFEGSFEYAIETLIRGITESAAAHPGSWRLLLSSGSGIPTVLVELNDAARNVLRQRLTNFFQSVKDTGRLDDVDIELCARALVLLGEDAVHLVLANSETYSPERFIAFAQWMARTMEIPGRP